MIFNWKDYFLLAQQLVEKANNSSIAEAMQRSAISRAYYSAFIGTLRYLEENGLFIPNMDDKNSKHSAVIKMCEAGPERKLRSIGSSLRQLRHKRTQADYEDEFEKITEVVNLSISKAEKVQQLVDELSQKSNQPHKM